ncbi:MAG: hypothetical protein KQH53_08335 [Desulfarculaceae bacterium]|nr:hypothetical protein [Desulfarculaceae bacterium]
MTIETPTNPQGQAPEAQPNPAEPGAQVPDGSAGTDGDELAGLVQHPELEDTTPPTGAEAGSPASGEPEDPTGEGQAAPGDGEGPPPEAGDFKPITITYNGKQHTIDSPDKATELIQKGLDYQVKMQRLAPHRGNLQLLYQAMNDPKKAAQLKAILTGQEDSAQGPKPATAGAGQELEIDDNLLMPVEGPDGQTVYVKPDPAALDWIKQVVNHVLKPHLSQLQGQGQEQSQQTGDPYVGSLVQQAKEGELSRYIDANYPGSASWQQARDLVIEAMTADGIGPGHPGNDDPNTWLSYYMRLGMAGKLPARESAELKTTPKTPNKSELKVSAGTPTPSLAKPPDTKTSELVLKAITPGADDIDFDAAIEALVTHPDLK